MLVHEIYPCLVTWSYKLGVVRLRSISGQFCLQTAHPNVPPQSFRFVVSLRENAHITRLVFVKSQRTDEEDICQPQKATKLFSHYRSDHNILEQRANFILNTQFLTGLRFSGSCFTTAFCFCIFMFVRVDLRRLLIESRPLDRRLWPLTGWLKGLGRI